MSVMVITGGAAGAGKATVPHFTYAGYHVALIARGETGLQEAQQTCEWFGTEMLATNADIADVGALQRAVAEVEAALSAIDTWINNAMTTVLAPFRQMSEEEFRRVAEMTYLGYVSDTRAALEVMAPWDQGVIIQTGSALAWRSIPLQSAYCEARATTCGSTDAMRTELMRGKSRIQLTIIQLPGMNTAWFGQARNKMGQAIQPVPSVYQSEVVAEVIYSVIQHPVNELWVGKSTIQSILDQVFFPRLLNRLMMRKAWEGQFTDQPRPAEHQDGLFMPVHGNHPGHGPFNDGA